MLLFNPENKTVLFVWDYYRIDPQKKNIEHFILVINIQKNSNGKVISDTLHIILNLNKNKDVAVLECAWNITLSKVFRKCGNNNKLVKWQTT